MSLIKILTTLSLCLGLLGCSQSIKDSSISDEVIKTDIIDYLSNSSLNYKNIIDFTTVSQDQNEDSIEVISDFNFSTGSASINGEMTLTYLYAKSNWILSDRVFDLKSMIPFVESNSNEARNLIESDPKPIFDFATIYLFDSSKLTFISSTKVSDISVKYVFVYEDHQLNWDFKEQFTIEATFENKSGWSYSLLDWSYNESSDWAGIWQINWLDEFGNINERIQDIEILGDLSIHSQKGKNISISNGLSIKYTKNSIEYIATVTVDPHENSSNMLKIITGTGANDWFIIGVDIAAPNNVTGDAGYYAANDQYKPGELVRIK